MREGLADRLHLINVLGTTRHEIVQKVPPGQPTKALAAINLLKAGLQVLGNELDAPEPSPVTPTQEQIELALLKSVDVVTRARKLFENLQRFEQVLVADHTSAIVMDWTDGQKSDAQAYLVAQVAALKDAIDAL